MALAECRSVFGGGTLMSLSDWIDGNHISGILRERLLEHADLLCDVLVPTAADLEEVLNEDNAIKPLVWKRLLRVIEDTRNPPPPPLELEPPAAEAPPPREPQLLAAEESESSADEADAAEPPKKRGRPSAKATELSAAAAAIRESELELSRGGSSKYVGVCKDGRRWRSSMTVDGHTLQLGIFEAEIDAARAYADARKKAPKKAPPKKKEPTALSAAAAAIPQADLEISSRGGSSKYTGVIKDGQRWRAQMNVDGQTLKLGTFEAEIDAARAFAEARKKPPAKKRGPREGTSKFKGVSRDSKGQCWMVSIYVDGSRRSDFVGRFDDEKQAARAYDDACEANGKPRVNFPN